MRFASILFVLSFYSIACTSFGLLLYHVLSGRRNAQKSDPAPGEAALLATAFLLGQGTLASVWMLLSLAGLFSPGIVKAITGIAVLSGTPYSFKHLKGLRVQIKNIYNESCCDSWTWQIIALIGVLFCVAGVSSLGAPLLEDSAHYYMTQAKVIAETYRYQLIPGKEIHYSGGFQGEMNHAVLLSLGNEDAARLYSWVTLLAGIVMLLALCTRSGIGRRGQWIALAMLVTSSMIHTLLGKGKTDLFPMAMGLGVYYWMTHESPHSRRVAGLLAGFAVLGKVVYAITLLPGMFVLLVWNVLQKQVNHNWNLTNCLVGLLRNGMKLAFWGSIPICTMFIYNYVLLGNPFVVSDFLSNYYGWADMAPYVPSHIYVTAPLYLVFGRISGQLGNLSVLTLMFAPLVFLLPRSKIRLMSILTALTISGLSGLAVLAIFFPTIIVAPRFYMSCIFLLIPLSSRAAEYVTTTEHRPRILTFAVQLSLLVVLFVTFLENTQGGYYNSFYFKKSILYLQGKLGECGLEDEWLGQRCRALSLVNHQAQPGDRILSSAPHNYYLRSDLLLCGSSDWTGDLADGKSLTLDWREIYRNGYRFMVIDMFYMQPPNVQDHPNWVKVAEVYQEGDLIVYRLDYVSPPEMPQMACREVEQGVWKVVGLPK
jgi:hypothetical protein